jgi:hypothetical protein
MIPGKTVLIDQLNPELGAKLVEKIADDNARALKAKKKRAKKKNKKKG